MVKVIINMEYHPKYGDLKKAALALGLKSTAALEMYVAGKTDAIGKEKRKRIELRYERRAPALRLPSPV